jgi:polyisoprenoid-binding protein YceI
MKIAHAVTVAALALGIPSAAFADDYAIDPAHTKAEFAVRHMMVSTVHGQFSNIQGTVHYDPKNVAATTIDVTIDATTIDTREPKRDAHLKSPDFFDTAKFPTLTFKSTKAWQDGDRIKVAGELTMHGVTKPVELTVDAPTAPVKDPWGNWKVGATATTSVNRTDFGLNWNKALEAGGVLVGTDVKIELDVELAKK